MIQLHFFFERKIHVLTNLKTALKLVTTSQQKSVRPTKVSGDAKAKKAHYISFLVIIPQITWAIKDSIRPTYLATECDLLFVFYLLNLERESKCITEKTKMASAIVYVRAYPCCELTVNSSSAFDKVAVSSCYNAQHHLFFRLLF